MFKDNYPDTRRSIYVIQGGQDPSGVDSSRTSVLSTWHWFCRNEGYKIFWGHEVLFQGSARPGEVRNVQDLREEALKDEMKLWW